MRIAVLNCQTPFVTGGAEAHASSLVKALNDHGHIAETVTIPFKWYPASTLVDAMIAAHAIDISESCGNRIDLAIGLKFPAYLMRHPNKIAWVLHQHREAYELYDERIGALAHDTNGRAVRDAIKAVDTSHLGQCKKLFANSKRVAERMARNNDLIATPLYHPPPSVEDLRHGAYGDYLYAPSRISSLKRQTLILEALAQTQAPVKAVFSGAPDDAGAEREFLDLRARLGLEARAEVAGRVSREAMIDLYANTAGVVFVPQDEDYGYVTLEAMLSAKPVITTTDSGGPLEFIADDETGLVAKPTAASIAAAMDRLWADKALCRRLGQAGYEAYRSLDINWSNVVRSLVS